MNVRIVTAGAGTGKTWRLTGELVAAIAARRAHPVGIVAATFTTHAAAELIERARAGLLAAGRVREAHELLAARIGTVHGVCGALVEEFAFELGVSPAVRVLDDAAAELELRRALARVVPEDRVEELERLGARLDPVRDWRGEVRRIVEAARANGLGGDRLAACAARSMRELEEGLGAVTADDLDGVLAGAMAAGLAAIEGSADDTRTTAAYAGKLRTSLGDLGSPRGLAWGAWAQLAKDAPAKRSRAHAEGIQRAAHRHLEHPRLRAELRRLIWLLFETAGAALAAYEAHKRARGVVDFVDQETLALALLRRPDVRAALAGQIDLFLVDELQDTSPIQLAVFLELARLAAASVWVGDPKQAIYGFRGTDPGLVEAAVRALGGGPIETLGTSYRSRPALVALTSAVFARAFAAQGIDEGQTRLVAASAAEPAGLGEVIEHWPLDVDRGRGTDNEAGRAAAVAAGVRDLLARAPRVRDRGGAATAAGYRDVAVLCRTNRQCQAVADALGALGVAVVVPRMGLFATAEARVVRAGLALWIDPRDALAAAELARAVTYPADPGAFVERVLEAPGRAAFRDDPAVARLASVREGGSDLGPVAAVDAVIAATELRALCAGWGDAAQRLANLDAIRAHATAYVRGADASGHAPTIAGLLQHLDALAPEAGGWPRARGDWQAVLAGEDAVTVTTWHRAKGLEWPIVVLFGLEDEREPTSYGVHVLGERDALDLDDPLGGRWIRCWPDPYAASNQRGAVRDAIERTAAHAALVARADREALRLLYVGWTRARDRVVLAARRGELLGGIAGKLAAIDPSLIAEPAATEAGVERVRWAGLDVDVRIAPSEPAPGVAPRPEPGMVTLGRPPALYAPARRAASAALAVPCSLGEVIALGPRIPIRGGPEMEAVGDAIHGFFAADGPGLGGDARLALARDLLAGHGVLEHVGVGELVVAASRLWAWIAARFPGARMHREWPICHRTGAGTLVVGTADLVLAARGGVVVIDHKTFPGTAEAAAWRALGYAGQLAAYADAIRAATGAAIASTWIHFPVRGRLVEIRLAAGAAGAPGAISPA